MVCPGVRRLDTLHLKAMVGDKKFVQVSDSLVEYCTTASTYVTA